MKRKLFVPDFAAILPYGHNAAGVDYFSNYFKSQFEEVHPIVCRALPESVDYISNEARQAPYLYTRNMIRDIIPPAKSPFSWKTENSVQLRFLRKYIHRLNKYDIFSRIAVKFFKKLISKHGVCDKDAFFFHSATYYEIFGLLKALKNVPLKKWPTIHFRLINVFEHANIDQTGYSTVAKLLQMHFKRESEDGIKKVFISSEVPAYTEKLMRDTAGSAIITPYPPMDASDDDNRDGRFTIASLGAGREDKGFFRLKNIINTFFSKYPDAYARFVIQSVNQKNIIDNYEQAHYISQLHATPKVEILEHTLTKEEMDHQFSRTDLVILPYDPITYQIRGSAILMESIGQGKPILATKGCGFSEYINIYGNGALCVSDEDFADKIYEFMHKEKDEITKMTNLAKSRHQEYFDNYYAKVWG